MFLEAEIICPSHTHLHRAPQHVHQPEHSLKGAVLHFCLCDRAGVGGEDPLLHHRQHLGPLLELLHQHMLHVHQAVNKEEFVF